MIASDVDRAAHRATTLWAVIVIRSVWRERYRQDGERHRVQVTDVDQVEWCLDEAHADRRVAELRKERDIAVRKMEMPFARHLEAGMAHELCELMSVAWAERAGQTRSES